MNNWSILGIEPTDDRELIKRAYMVGLGKYNPEDDPEGFSAFRAAYESILKELDKKVKASEGDNSPLDLFIKQLTDIYNDIDKRRDDNLWKELLEDEVCIRLDLAEATEQKVLTFLMDNNILAKRIWILLDQRFDWQNRTDTLKQQFPPNFIDFIIRSLAHEDLPEELFELDLDAKAHHYDKWVQLYFEMAQMISVHRTDEPLFSEKQKELESLPLRHIYYRLQLARMHIGKSEHEPALAITEELYSLVPGDVFTRYTYAMSLLYTGSHEAALEHFKDMLAKNPAYIDAKKGIVDVHLATKDYNAAREVLLDILNEFPFDAYAYPTFQLVTEELIKLLEEEHKEKPDDFDLLFNLAKNYINANHLEKCQTLLKNAPAASDDTRYYEYMAEVYSRGGSYEKAIPLYETLLSREQKHIHYNGYVRTLIALNKMDEALEQTEKALSFEEQDEKNLVWTVALYDQKGYVLYTLGRFEDALVALDKGIAINDKSANLYHHKAKVYQSMGLFSEALECCETVRLIIPYMSDAYTLQMEIYNNAGMYEQMLAISDLADQVNFNSPRIKYHKAGALRMLEDNASAGEIINALIADEFDEGYRDLFHVEASHLAEAAGKADEAISHIKKAIELNPENLHHSVILGNLYRSRKEYKEAQKVFDELIKKNSDHIMALVGRGDLFIDQNKHKEARKDFEAVLAIAPEYDMAFGRIVHSYNVEKEYDKAIEWARRRLEVFGLLNDYLDIAHLYRNAGKMNDAEKAYQEAIEFSPESGDGYASYGYFLVNRGRIKEAIGQFKLALEKDPQLGNVYEELAYHLENEKAYDEALSIVEQAWALELGNRGMLAMRKGFILKGMRRFQEAVESMQQAIELFNEMCGSWSLADIYDRIASLYELDLNNGDVAFAYYTKALEQNSKYISSLRGIGDIYFYHFKDYKKALEYYDKKIVLEPDEPGVFVVKARAYKKLGKHIQAWLTFKKAIKLYKKQEQNETTDKGTLCPEVYLANCYMGLGKHKLAIKGFLAMLDKPHRKKSWCDKSACDVCLYGLGQIAELDGDLEKALEYYEAAILVSDSVKHNYAKRHVLEKMGR